MALSDNIRSQLRLSDTLQRLLILNVALFLTVRIINAVTYLFMAPVLSFPQVSYWLAVPSNISSLIVRPWTIITYMFFHWEVMHILFNMLWLFWMGKIFQEYLGAKKLLSTYILGGITGAIFFIAAYNFFPLFSDSYQSAYALGASASVLAITVAAATLLPEFPIQLLLFGTVKLKWIALVTILLDVISVGGSNAGGHISHIGGAVYGFTYIKLLQKGTDIGGWLTHIFDRLTPGRKMKTAYRAPKKKDEDYNVNRKAGQERMDEILDKISRSGYGSLTSEEREFLFKISKDQ